jgi:serine protease Do
MKYGITTTGVMILESKYTEELKLGDKIISVGGVEVSTSDQFEIVLKSYSVGDTIDIKIHRNNENLTVKLTLREKVPDSLVFD